MVYYFKFYLHFKVKVYISLTFKLGTFYCGHYNVFKKISNFYFAHENMKNPPPKSRTLKHIFRHFRNFPLLPRAAQTTQTVEFMFSNVAYRATVYRSEPVMRIADIKFKTRGVCFVEPRRTKL